MKKILLLTIITLLLSCTKDDLNNKNSYYKLHADLWVDNIHYNINKDWGVVNGKTYEEWVNSTGKEYYDAWLSGLSLNHPYMLTYAISDDKKDTFYINTINTKKGGIGIGSYSKRNNKINFIYPTSFSSSSDTLSLKMNYNNNAKYLYDIRIEFIDSMLLLENNKYRKVPVKFSYK
jgi:hypothetical protein